MFTHQTKIHLQNIDAAGLIFYANIFVLIHETFEAFMLNSGISLQNILATKKALFLNVL